MKKLKLLLVEDEADLGKVVSQYLEISDFEVDWVTNGQSACGRLLSEQHDYHMALIDVSMPEMDGFQVADRLVQSGRNIPFFFLTARNEKSDRLRGLKLGADDYISKPFDVDELVLRIRNIVKRNIGLPAATPSTIVLNDLTFEKESFRLSIGKSKPVVLTPREAELLGFFIANENRVLKREDILCRLWGSNDYFLGRSLDVFVSRLRKHLGHSTSVSIDNVYGVGFAFNVQR
jgi:DNA-binding response OmpR family regulator